MHEGRKCAESVSQHSLVLPRHQCGTVGAESSEHLARTRFLWASWLLHTCAAFKVGLEDGVHEAKPPLFLTPFTFALFFGLSPIFFSGNDTHYTKISADLNMFAVHSGPDSIRTAFSAQVSLQEAYESYLPGKKNDLSEGRPPTRLPFFCNLTLHIFFSLPHGREGWPGGFNHGGLQCTQR